MSSPIRTFYDYSFVFLLPSLISAVLIVTMGPWFAGFYHRLLIKLLVVMPALLVVAACLFRRGYWTGPYIDRAAHCSGLAPVFSIVWRFVLLMLLVVQLIGCFYVFYEHDYTCSALAAEHGAPIFSSVYCEMAGGTAGILIIALYIGPAGVLAALWSARACAEKSTAQTQCSLPQA